VSLWKRYGAVAGEPDEITLRRIERRVLDGVDAKPRRIRPVALPILAAGLLAAVLLAFVLVRSDPREPESAWVVISTTERAQQVSLPHGGALWVGLDSRVELAASDSSGATVRLHEGDVTLHVHAGEGLRWRVEVDAWVVEAVGTRFRVQRSGGGAPDVQVDEGVVRLTGPGQPEDGLLVSAVEPEQHAVWQGSEEDPARAAQTEAVTDVADAADEVPAVEPVEVPEPTVGPGLRTAPRWVDRFRDAIAAGDDETAVAALPARFPSGREPLTASDYLDAGDALASRRDPTRAEAAYRAACRSLEAPACGVATFRRALMASRARDPQEAIRLATAYLEQHPDGSLAREVLGRRMRWHSVHGSSSAARDDARTYLARWPAGPHRELARRLLGESSDIR
jgi:hypothetical protein